MPLPSTMTPIATQTLTSASASFTFSSIPQTYTDLMIVMGSMTTDANGRTVYLRYNGDSGTNYSYTRITGDGTYTSSERASTQDHIRPFYGVVGSNTGNPTTGTINIQNYSNSTTNKTLLSRTAVSGEVNAVVGLWRSTAAVTSIVFSLNAGTYSAGTTFTLYGIKAA